MRFASLLPSAVVLGCLGVIATTSNQAQTPLLHHADGRNISVALFAELEELARIVDIAYCVGLTGLGINKPFQCLSRCSEFEGFELVRSWNTGPLLSDSCGYIALDHGQERILVAFRGTYSIANTIVDLSTVPQQYTPYPGSDEEGSRQPGIVAKDIYRGLTDHATRNRADDQSEEPKCLNCTVHMGFQTSWRNTRNAILSDLEEQMALFPNYKLHLVGHSLGGAVAALAGLDFQARGWNPIITTFGEPRIGNVGLVDYLDARFNLLRNTEGMGLEAALQYRRVTHVDDPVPLLPLSEWDYAMHAGEIHISKPSLSPDLGDIHHCNGDNDQLCIAGQDPTTPDDSAESVRSRKRGRADSDLLASVKEEVYDVLNEPWGIPSRYKLWQLFFAHRDYFWRLGLCVPGGDPLGGGGKYERGAMLDD